MKFVTTLLILSTSLLAQRIETLATAQGGRFVKDPSGTYLRAQSVPSRDATNRDIRLVRFSEDPSAFEITIGGSGNDDLTAIRVAPNGDIFLLGTTDSQDFPASPSPLWSSATPPAGTNSFLVRVSSEGRILSSTFIASTDLSITAKSLAISSDGSLIIGAELRGDGLAKFGDRLGDRIIPGTGSLLLLKTDQAVSQLLTGTRIGSASSCNAQLTGLQTNESGALFLAGSTCGDDFPTTPNAYLKTRPGGTCSTSGFFPQSFPCTSGIIARLDPVDLHILAATYLGGTAAAEIRDLAVDAQGNPYVTGKASIFPASDAFPTTPGAFQEHVKARTMVIRPESVFVTKLTPQLDALVYSTFLNGSRSEFPTSLLVDQSGRAVVSGATVSTDFPATGAFRTPCGPDPGLNPPQTGFVTRLNADGTSLSASLIFKKGEAQLSFMDRERYVVVNAGGDYAYVDLESGDLPSVACLVNGANFSSDSTVAPNQLVTLFGANFSRDSIVLFGYEQAKLLYVSPTQINAIVPPPLKGRKEDLTAVLVTGTVFSNIRQLSIHDANPTVKIFVSNDGKLVDRGSPLADVRLSNGSANSLENAASYGEAVTIFTTGVDLQQPIEVKLGSDPAEILDAEVYPGSFNAVQVLRVRVPNVCCGGVRPISITNGPLHTANNAGFLWLQ